MANEEEDGEKSRDSYQRNGNRAKSQIVIGIPTYEEVLESSQVKSTPSLFKPSQSFSQAFAFVKSSDVYSPPPPPSAENPPGAHQVSGSSNQTLQSDVASSSSSSVNAAPLPSNSSQTRNAILVSNRQKGNPLLKHIRNVRWVFSDIIPDYLIGQNSCALYLSLRYHLLHPDYLYYRIRELQKNFKLRVVLCHIDVEDVVKPLLEVTKTAETISYIIWTVIIISLPHIFVLISCSMAECARYLETIKVYEHKPADLIQGQMDTDYLSRLNQALTTIRHVNKTDVVTLGSTFGSLAHIIDASMEDLARCPGIGERKVRRLYDTFHEPFKRAIPIQPPIPEATNPEIAADKDDDLQGTAEDEDFVEDSRKRKKKEPEKTVKSALSTVFARYSDKLGKKNEKQKGKDTNTQSDPEADKS
ncbi:PREDICTED: DNA excision repair protein ERCC-1 [Tarenaya hassleriana]|uniref:DNA excision repair protein ERCC-1 n=1 Tax=Tarenaya hassleriana TaxID=28532 RepID=UPI00053C0DC7|nr:PREDICTED: DNA excision repair protein ERCC-1 [Tarenaya hassleriana]